MSKQKKGIVRDKERRCGDKERSLKMGGSRVPFLMPPSRCRGWKVCGQALPILLENGNGFRRAKADRFSLILEKALKRENY